MLVRPSRKEGGGEGNGRAAGAVIWGYGAGQLTGCGWHGLQLLLSHMPSGLLPNLCPAMNIGTHTDSSWIVVCVRILKCVCFLPPPYPTHHMSHKHRGGHWLGIAADSPQESVTTTVHGRRGKLAFQQRTPTDDPRAKLLAHSDGGHGRKVGFLVCECAKTPSLGF